MIFDVITIYRARRDPRKATKLAAHLVQGQAIDRVATPIIVIQFALWAVAVIAGLLLVLSLWAAATVHGLFIVLCILAASLSAGCIWLALGIGRGLDSVRKAASALSDRSVDRLAERRHTHKSRTVTDPAMPDREPD